MRCEHVHKDDGYDDALCEDCIKTQGCGKLIKGNLWDFKCGEEDGLMGLCEDCKKGDKK